jgi:hypothetical protein
VIELRQRDWLDEMEDFAHASSSCVLSSLLLYAINLVDLNLQKEFVGNRTYIYLGPVRELLINSEKARISSIFKKNAERFLCLQFLITHAH